MAYLLDTDVFITAKNSHYGMDFCPAFWEWLIQQNASGVLFSVDQVEHEILNGNDELVDWVKSLDSGFFLPTEDIDDSSVEVVGKWVRGGRYENSVAREFFDGGGADHYLITLAHRGRHTLVTHETRDPGRRKVVKIPDVCDGIGVECINPFEMLRRERARFVLP